MNQPELSLNYSIPDILEKIILREDDMRALAAYYSIEFRAMHEARAEVWRNRLGNYMAESKEPYDPAAIDEIISGEKIPESDGEQVLLNLNSVRALLEDKRGTRVDMPLLHELHTMLSARLSSQHNAGKLRPMQSNDLFSASATSGELPDYSALQQLLPQMIQLGNDRAIPALVRAWLFYYVFISIQPFATHNDLMASIATEHILRQQDDDFNGLLNLEKHLFFSDEMAAYLAELTEQRNYRQALVADLSPFLELCLGAYDIALKETKEILQQAIKTELRYEELTPRQKNGINYWLDTFFHRHRHKLDKLTERQQEILEMLLKNGWMQNKDFVPLYRLDRKTIQRDFNVLLDEKLVTSRGAGRSLTYCLDMKVALD